MHRTNECSSWIDEPLTKAYVKESDEPMLFYATSGFRCVVTGIWSASRRRLRRRPKHFARIQRRQIPVLFRRR